MQKQPTEGAVWDGRSPLTEWPQRDWMIILRDPSYDLIWDRPPLTSAYLWTRRMGNFGHGNDNDGSFTSTEPYLVSGEVRDRQDRTWERIKDLLRERTTQEQNVSTPASPPQPVAVKPETRLRLEADNCANSGKIKHKSKLWALQHRIQLAAQPDERHPERLEVYKCKWCGHWHVGHRLAA